MADPQISIFFSDDTRDEIGNKTSIMGLLGPDMNITTNMPSDVPLTINISIGALCRFFSPEPVDTVFEIRFHSAHDAEKIAPPPASKFVMSPPKGESEWTSQIVGAFNALTIHDGMRIEALLNAGGKEYAANLNIRLHLTSNPDAS